MKNFSNTYIFIFSTVMVILVALLLSLAAMQLKPFQDKNIEVEKKQNILASIRIKSTPQDAVDLYAKYITNSFVINNKGEKQEGVDAFIVDMKNELGKPAAERNLPVYVGTLDDGTNAYVMPLRGKGLWGPIWGYISLKPDMNTVYGAIFDHQGETPGLGAEIATSWFQEPFFNKQIFKDSTEFISIKVIKGGAPKGDMHAVDAISSGTITSKALEAMLDSCLVQYKTFYIQNRH
ncbi:MAG: NADH:ubiquinone reductase (Na(+)-transporting) subunit C [Bacteroidetes bacterium GWF2_42_66]|nr:MAG: NADH:ubiquinone reductase (Na(+)-transporting) subunit C [Bacteroidetes bacterium GWA2_42_15]OFX99964.1 MAG: NADH:ubiquinone reductase (Na(+)-transporting) subunit C [Bacteroidetes bacterium GWE2_42_39]OFY40149.1 MAG: NADH:ubiquinone reductase (Na(+)-transporting) subunit C [Bacteroidetes bacterium GWF2_42_66]HBL73977.1 NADH:ubiquinone reductase (Na(+)-transporting) subunit C [Prolixibacteraceae bacterium]HCR89212.1 NADH:ubiquinone reductase (Na(+)-transporting) subunit C [Prolixibacter